MADPNAVRSVRGAPDPKPRTADAEIEARNEAQERLRNRQRLEALVARLTVQALEQVARKQTIETRWLEDMRQYYGRYDSATEAKLNSSTKSRMFINMTRPKTHSWEARLSDMLFPTDQRNWGIQATPVPELAQIIQANQPEDPNVDTIGGEGEGQAIEEPPEVKQAKAMLDASKTAAQGMELEIADQFDACDYEANQRQILRDACKLGTGICKGPTLSNKRKKRWVKDPETGETVLKHINDPKPDMRRVDPWSFYPDMSATRMSEASFAYERHLYTAKQVRDLQNQPGFDKDALRKILVEGPHEGYPSHVTQLREVTESGQDTLKERFHVWEYHGPIEREDLEAIFHMNGDAEMLDEYDPLEEVNVIVWFCQGTLLKFAEQPLESGDFLYSVFNFERDDTSMFGYGVPYLMRDSQKAMNGAWRMVMDNGGLSAGPQIEIDTNAIEPADGSWEMTPRKVWKRKKGVGSNIPDPIKVHNIPNNQKELTNIITLARQFADDETSLPVIEQRGAESDKAAAHVSRTAMGMAMLMNSVNVVFRRVVKDFDDDMTVPNLQRMYDWNMQFSPKDHIKGDFDIDARGSSVLLVREIQAQNLMAMAERYTNHPVLGGMTKAASLYRKTVEAHMLSPSDIVMTDDEIRAEQKRREEQGNQDPELLKLEMQLQIAQMDNEARLQVAQLGVEEKLISLAETSKMNLDKLKAMLMKARMDIDSKERVFAGEAAVQERMAAQGDNSGGGGYL